MLAMSNNILCLSKWSKWQTFSSADVFSSSDLEHKKRLVDSSFIGNKVILWSDATFVAHFLQVADWCFALKPRNLTAHKRANIRNASLNLNSHFGGN